MAEKQEEAVDQVAPEQEAKVEEPKKDTGFQEDGTYKVDLTKLNDQQEEKVVDEKVEEPVEEVVEEPTQQEETPVLQEVTEEEEQPEVTEEVVEEVEEKIEDKTPEVELPENVEELVKFMNETGGTLEDYVRLNADYSNIDSEALLREYYKSTKPHLSSEEVNFMLEDNFSFDEETDEPRDVKRKKLAYKEAVAEAKQHLEGLKGKYYEDLKLGSKLTKEQQKAINFFNRYNKEQEQANELQQQAKTIFNKETDKVFNEDFKGFDFKVGDKKYRYNVKDVQGVKEDQSELMDYFKPFVGKNNTIVNAGDYHKTLFAGKNADAIATHFYEQGKADAIKNMTSQAKNINMDARKTDSGVVDTGGIKVRAISGDDSSKLKFKLKNY